VQVTGLDPTHRTSQASVGLRARIAVVAGIGVGVVHAGLGLAGVVSCNGFESSQYAMSGSVGLQSQTSHAPFVVGIDLARIAEARAVIARVADPVVIAVGLQRIGVERTVVGVIPDAVGVGVGGRVPARR
jgi:hypothetical protein